MIKQEEVFRIGRLGRPHGVKGEIIFMFDDDVFDRVDADYLVLNIEGILVPFVMEAYRFRNDSTALMKFRDIDTENAARELTGCDVFFPRKLAGNEDRMPSWNELTGYRLTDEKGHDVGIIASVDDSTANVLFETTEGRLLPANPDLIAAIDREQRTITLNLPEGILDI